MKLQYGFNFIDEGYHMVESWRLAAGDHFLKDKQTGALRHFTLINAVIFKLHPDITLLGFRQVQFVLTLVALVMLSLSLYRIDRNYWYLPLVFSLFAFTGLDPVGMISNLYYHTYPHLFVVLHAGFFVLGIISRGAWARAILFALSGVWLWLMSLSLLHMSVMIASPVVVFLVLKKIIPEKGMFCFSDLCLCVAPFIILWGIFLAVFHALYIQNIMNSLQLILSTPTHTAGALVQVNWELIKHMAVTGGFLALFLVLRVHVNVWVLGACLVVGSLLMFIFIHTSLFGIISPYYNGWFGAPMWFTSFIVSFLVIFWIIIGKKILRGEAFSNEEVVAVMLAVPSTIMAVVASIFSALGALSVLHSSILSVACLSMFLLYTFKAKYKGYLGQCIVLVLLLAPFYITTSLSDWRFTFFDVAPQEATVVIEEGFGKGIKTNAVYNALYQWIFQTSQRYSDEGDFMLSYILSPMTHMIAKRRPSLDETFVNYGEVPLSYFEEEVKRKQEASREPSIAYVFEAMPAIMPKTSQTDTYRWFGRQIDIRSQPRDPLTQYVLSTMVLVDEFKVNTVVHARCFVRRDQ